MPAAKLDYLWHLRKVMAEHGMFNTSDLIPLLAERGITLSSSQVYRLVTERPERLSMKVFMALLDILDCRMEDLLEPVAGAGTVSTPKKKAASAGNSAPEPGLGTLRPKRARITGIE
ncbi:helix-turn-helix domain-containing protein [Streptomyces sp. NPDC050085]|uniref:helix-turn-helix domain-containing protein n=1 Tax=Streptomyces sp. NPDC050085 TaxID=3365600 RepID=UPI00379239FF